ncbi:hypothetical protein CK510_03460 [Brunnivagina elsteri CCALA 953]|uniref:Sulfatase-modifying factor enzyme domain-containing protein n=2 Tax=Brunnivagina TaxID=3344733 RepID=A0A2A2TP12_9CYAN|nr:hypothetical protein CK510_03460 [Calothrix elsteri CCALA 953]
MRLAETENVLDVVSEYIAEKIDSPFKSFTALLSNLSNLSQEQQVNLLPFAHVATEVLHNLGGKYADFAKKIEVNRLQKIIDGNLPFFQLFAGEYICAVKWGGETGIWHEGTENLLISTQGEVQFRSRFGLAVIQNLAVQKQTLSWSFDNNQTAASITLIENSENSYFWEENQTGKLFEGWLNYPNEGRIDFRGKFVIIDPLQFSEFTFESATIILIDDSIKTQTFYFEVAIIKVNQSNSDNILEIDRSPAQAIGFVEDLGRGIQLRKTQLEMMLIPGGTFAMGSPAEELEHRDNESPQHTVTVQPFFMGKYPITQAQWKAVAKLPKVNQDLKPEPSNFKGDNLPVEQVSWYDAVEFCDRISKHTSKSYRLPSEAEWEYACRAGTTTPFYFGETITTDLANYRGVDNEEYKWSGSYGQGPKGIYREKTEEVGSFGVANAFGLYDMHGNVWEWCLDDSHDSYEGAPTDGSAWIYDKDNTYQNKKNTVLLGGSWDNNPEDCRSAYRNYYSWAGRGIFYNFIGFRIVCGVGRTLE